MAEIKPAFRFLMGLEGGGTLHQVKGDPGGRTVYGIAENHHPEMFRPTPPTEAQAIDFYRRKYWDPLRLGELDNQAVADEIFEFAANASTPRVGEANVAVRIAQEAVNDVGARMRLPHVGEDGKMGPRTLAALNALGVGTVEALAWDGRFNLRQLVFYRGLRQDLVERFFVGWSRRVAA